MTVATRLVGGNMRVEVLSWFGIRARWMMSVRVTLMGSAKLVIASAERV